MKKQISITGERFGSWEVLERAGRSRTGETKWLCQCNCGSQKILASKALRGILVASCQCNIPDLVTHHSGMPHVTRPMGHEWLPQPGAMNEAPLGGSDDPVSSFNNYQLGMDYLYNEIFPSTPPTAPKWIPPIPKRPDSIKKEFREAGSKTPKSISMRLIL